MQTTVMMTMPTMMATRTTATTVMMTMLTMMATTTRITVTTTVH